jgi:1,4-alpha-glucan branching enzyme
MYCWQSYFLLVPLNLPSRLKATKTTVQRTVETVEWAEDAIIYEVNIRQFTPEGTFTAFKPHIARLKDLGVDILWIMPIHPIGEKNRKGTLGSYYSVKNYKGVNPDFGTLDDFKTLVEEAHLNGMYVIIDWGSESYRLGP